MQVEVKKAKSIIAERNKDIQKKNTQKEEIISKTNDIKLKIKEHAHEIKKLEDNYVNAQHKVRYFIYIVMLLFIL